MDNYNQDKAYDFSDESYGVYRQMVRMWDR